MATTRRESLAGSSSKPAKPFSPSSSKKTSPDKNVPNYLKPTLSSQPETSTSTSTSASTSTSTFLKKKAHDNAPKKSSFERRRSFDRPPSAIQRSPVSASPKDKLSQPVSVRTTSFYPSSAKGGSQSARVFADQPTRAPLKSSGSVPSKLPAKTTTTRRSLTFSAPSSKKPTPRKLPAASPSKKAPASAHAPTGAGFDDNEPLNLGDDIEEIASIGSDADLVPFDHIELSCSPDANACIHSYERDVSKKATQDPRAPSEHREDKEVRNESDRMESKCEDDDNEEGVRLARVAAPVPEEGKKQSPVYNDVIKEAASKLLEKRKNKVSALVGAFETVISLQETDS